MQSSTPYPRFLPLRHVRGVSGLTATLARNSIVTFDRHLILRCLMQHLTKFPSNCSVPFKKFKGWEIRPIFFLPLVIHAIHFSPRVVIYLYTYEYEVYGYSSKMIELNDHWSQFSRKSHDRNVTRLFWTTRGWKTRGKRHVSSSNSSPIPRGTDSNIITRGRSARRIGRPRFDTPE